MIKKSFGTVHYGQSLSVKADVPGKDESIRSFIQSRRSFEPNRTIYRSKALTIQAKAYDLEGCRDSFIKSIKKIVRFDKDRLLLVKSRILCFREIVCFHPKNRPLWLKRPSTFIGIARCRPVPS